MDQPTDGVTDPIFITGNRRAGTTLLYNLICQYTGLHPQIAEVQPLTQILAALDWSEKNYERMTCDFFASRDDFERYAGCVARLFVKHASEANGHPRRLILKNPELSHHLAALRRAFPDAHVIACTRDPRDQIASEVEVGRHQNASFATTEDGVSRLISSFCRYLEPVVELAETAPEFIKLVRYEDIVTSPEDVLIRLAQFCRVLPSIAKPPTTWCDVNDLLARMKTRPSYSELYGKPVTAEKVGRYVERLPRPFIEQIEVGTAKIMQRVETLCLTRHQR